MRIFAGISCPVRVSGWNLISAEALSVVIVTLSVVVVSTTSGVFVGDGWSVMNDIIIITRFAR